MTQGDPLSEVHRLDYALGRRVTQLLEAIAAERGEAEEKLRQARQQVRQLQQELSERSLHTREVLHHGSQSHASMVARYARARGFRLFRRGGALRKVETEYFLCCDCASLAEAEAFLDQHT